MSDTFFRMEYTFVSYNIWKGCVFLAKKMIFMIFIYIITAIIILPAIITYCSYHSEENTNETQTTETEGELASPEIIRHNTDELEEYIKGVVAAEMPALFEKEALKAQAVSARTYAVRKMKEMNTNTIPYNIGQAYITVDEMKQKWKNNFEEYYNKISEAVEDTKGEIMIYNNEPILAVFHAESGGKTESAENVWQKEIPYLKSVDSSLDKNAPNFETNISFTFDEIIKRFCSQYSDCVLNTETLPQQFYIQSCSPAGYVQKMQIGNKIVTGREVREILNLRSTNFTINIENNNITFTTKGYGHGAGMSQYGSMGMAEKGFDYQQILEHYFEGAKVQRIIGD